MKSQADLVQGWLRKAHSDMIAVEALVNASTFDTACFHAQQAAEKYLKAYLTQETVTYPYTHNFVKLVDLCADLDDTFRTLLSIVTPLVPYAVELRYDAEFWPDEQTAREAHAFALDVERFVLMRIPVPDTGDEIDE
jgi:HEPN domain-containing protein